MPDALEVLAEVEQALGTEGHFEPIWSTRHGRYDGYYACIDNNYQRVQHKCSGATQLDAAIKLLDRVRTDHPDLFVLPAIAAE